MVGDRKFPIIKCYYLIESIKTDELLYLQSLEIKLRVLKYIKMNEESVGV